MFFYGFDVSDGAKRCQDGTPHLFTSRYATERWKRQDPETHWTDCGMGEYHFYMAARDRGFCILHTGNSEMEVKYEKIRPWLNY